MDSDGMRLVADFLDPVRRAQATHELAARGAGAVFVVASVLDGTARNQHAVPYRTFGEALRCALVTARFLGPFAIPLEAAVASELANLSPTIRMEAATALGALPSLTEPSAVKLAMMLEDEPDPAMAAAAAILRLKLSEHVAVVEIVARSASAARAVAQAQEWMKKRGSLP